jgi:hypothetical protein
LHIVQVYLNKQFGAPVVAACCLVCPCRLLVNLVTSVTLGLALAAEPAEPTVMERPPRRPNKRLVGKLLLWRCFFVCHLVVVLVLGMFEWALITGLSLGQARAEAFNVLVGAQVVYFITCRWAGAASHAPYCSAITCSRNHAHVCVHAGCADDVGSSAEVV